jgi:hypothetical protein
MAGGINNFSPMIGSNASQLMKNLQQLIASNPDYLTSGIPTHLIQKMWKNEPESNVMLTPKVTQNAISNRIFDVCFYFSYYFTLLTPLLSIQYNSIQFHPHRHYLFVAAQSNGRGGGGRRRNGSCRDLCRLLACQV